MRSKGKSREERGEEGVDGRGRGRGEDEGWGSRERREEGGYKKYKLYSAYLLQCGNTPAMF